MHRAQHLQLHYLSSIGIRSFPSLTDSSPHSKPEDCHDLIAFVDEKGGFRIWADLLAEKTLHPNNPVHAPSADDRHLNWSLDMHNVLSHDAQIRGSQ